MTITAVRDKRWLPSGVWRKLFLILMAALAAFSLTFAADIHKGGGYYSNFVGTVAAFFVWLVVFAFLNCVVYRFADDLVRLLNKARVNRIFQKLSPVLEKGNVIIFTGIMLAFWLAYIVFFFPGTTNYDTFYQIYQCYPENHPIMQNPYYPTQSYIENFFCDHHPIFDTLIYGFFCRVSAHFFGTWNYGLYAFALLQTVGIATGLTCTIAYLKRINTPPVVCSLVYLLCCILPIFPVYSIMVVKDSFQAWFFIPFMLCVAEIVRTKGGALIEGKRLLVSFIVLGILLGLTKKTGAYLDVAVVLILLIYCKEGRRRLLVQLVCVAGVVFAFVPYAIFPLLDVAPGGVQEALATPFQQTARYVVAHENEMSDSEKSAIDKVLGYDDLASRYDPSTADPVKNFFIRSSSRSDLMDYLKVWAYEGLKHPGTYVEATISTSAPYFVDDTELHCYDEVNDAAHYGSDLMYQPETLSGGRNALVSFFYLLSDLPIVAIFFKAALYTVWLPCIASIFLLRNDDRMLLACVPIYLCILICVITPVFDTRYLFSLIFSAPFLLGLTFSKTNVGTRA